MKETIISVIAILVFTLSAILIAAMRGGLSARAKAILLGLVAEAESYFGGGTGRIKFSAVLGRLYEMMPSLFGLLFCEKTVADWIEEAVLSLKGDGPAPEPTAPAAADGESEPTAAADAAAPENGGAA